MAHKDLFYLLVILCFVVSTLAKVPNKQQSISIPPDPCNQYDNCTACVLEKFCGWCSTPVKYDNGSQIGYQCAGFNKDNSSNPFTCYGTYSTEKCAVGYICNQTSQQCGITDPGNGEPLDQCEPICFPKFYLCSPVNTSCVETPASKGGIPMSACMAQCRAQNNTPVDIIGHWRGLQISAGYISGEWRLDVGASNATLYYPNATKVWDGTVSQVETYIIINITSGPDTGSKIYSLYQIAYGPVTKWVTIAASLPGGDVPLGFDDAMASPSAQEFVFVSCIDASICSFGTGGSIMDEYYESIIRKPREEFLDLPVTVEDDPPKDPCSPFPNCTACIAQQFCGWCTNKVIYNETIVGSNCAGFNPNGTDQRFVCEGSYSTQKCPIPPVLYACSNNACSIAESGSPASVCNATCGKNSSTVLYKCNVASMTCEPNNEGQDPATCNSTCSLQPFPVLLNGVWRGLQVSQNYQKGEWQMVITSNGSLISDFQLTSPINITLAGTMQHIASEAVLIVNIMYPIVTKKFSMYELAYGPETAYLTLANGQAGSDTYPSFIEAMTGNGMDELNFVRCLSAMNCKFKIY